MLCRCRPAPPPLRDGAEVGVLLIVDVLEAERDEDTRRRVRGGKGVTPALPTAGRRASSADPAAVVWTGPAEIPAGWGPCVVTIGVFDGVHRGHARPIERSNGRTIERSNDRTIEQANDRTGPPARPPGRHDHLRSASRHRRRAGPGHRDAVHPAATGRTGPHPRDRRRPRPGIHPAAGPDPRGRLRPPRPRRRPARPRGRGRRRIPVRSRRPGRSRRAPRPSAGGTASPPRASTSCTTPTSAARPP